ncbi:MAG: hypothetical protein HFI08_04580 [Bacilli bacterium]|jgi:hypothetical protein|nr:hypothetical protein [Bacilli bacterium]
MKVFVGCSSRDEIAEEYLQLASFVGKLLQNNELVIGGTCVGMMGRVAKEVNKTQLTQIVLADYVIEGAQKTEHFYVCETSFERMKQIWDQSDLFLFLPGGTGTLGEIITFLEENRAKKQKKKIIVFNYEHYYDDVFAFIEKAKQNCFSNEEILEGITFITSLKDLEEIL